MSVDLGKGAPVLAAYPATEVVVAESITIMNQAGVMTSRARICLYDLPESSTEVIESTPHAAAWLPLEPYSLARSSDGSIIAVSESLALKCYSATQFMLYLRVSVLVTEASVAWCCTLSSNQFRGLRSCIIW